MKTYTPRPKDIAQQWILVDAQDAILGRLATKIAHLLLGKHKALYDVNLITGDKVVVVNAEHIGVTGNKREQKIYYRHTGFPGGIKAPTFEEYQAKKPTDIIKLAVRGMLPRGPRGRAMLKNLYIYTGSEHPHQSQQPQLLEPQGV
ncbi:50S ribosomal protein L13 [bacterium]|jgi:large subunit ribosomal protein L13|nr:50S ribosomal protein L13 [bacterium]NBX72277.1 50S ribosomal protein L13 [bacterium]